MKKRVTSKSGLFLLEMMISILFFSIVAAICVQIFAKAHMMSRKAHDLNMAVSYASSGAELLTHLDTAEQLTEYLDGCEQSGEGRFAVYYDKDWKVCESENAYAWMEIMFVEEDGMRSAQFQVRLTAGEEPLYQLNTGRYLRKTVEAGDGNE